MPFLHRHRILALMNNRAIICRDAVVAETPLLVPSFSSKGLRSQQFADLVRFASEFVTDTALVSAYDLHYSSAPLNVAFPEVLFVDSGGYECSKDAEYAAVIGHEESDQRPWTPHMHRAVLRSLSGVGGVIAISFDHPDVRLKYSEQIGQARLLFDELPGLVSEILVKPESTFPVLGPYQWSAVNLRPFIEALATFSVIGVTEKEIGSSLAQRVRFIRDLRHLLEAAGSNTPIHVLGSLDFITTPLYFMAGADIFDGVTWARYAMRDGVCCYLANTEYLKYPVERSERELRALSQKDSLYALSRLQSELRECSDSRSLDALSHHREFLKATAKTCGLEV